METEASTTVDPRTGSGSAPTAELRPVAELQRNGEPSPLQTAPGGSNVKADAEMLDKPVLVFFRVGSLIVATFQLSYLALSWTSYGRHLPANLVTLSSLNLGVAVIGFLLTFTPSFRHWRSITLLICCVWTVNAGLMAQVTNEFDFLAFKYVLLMIGLGALIPWGWAWQAAYSAVTLAAYLLTAGMPYSGDSHQAMRWLALLTAAALAQISVALSSRRRKQIEAGVRKLREEATHRDAVIARLERARKQLEQSETKLRKIFEASPDTISILNLADGHFIDVSGDFVVTGYTRKEAVATTVSDLGIFATREQHRKFVNLLRSRGTVRNFEADFRLKDGTIRPCLLSGTIIESTASPACSRSPPT